MRWLFCSCSNLEGVVLQAKGRLPDQIATVATVVGGLVGVGILGYLGLTLSAVP